MKASELIKVLEKYPDRVVFFFDGDKWCHIEIADAVKEGVAIIIKYIKS